MLKEQIGLCTGCLVLDRIWKLFVFMEKAMALLSPSLIATNDAGNDGDAVDSGSPDLINKYNQTNKELQ